MAGVASVLRAASVALTEKEWEPLAKPVYFLGEVQALKAALSSLHSKVELASEEEKVNVALFCFMVPAGPESMVVFGAVVSCGGGGTTVTLKVEVALLPELSVAEQVTVVSPSANLPPEAGEQLTVTEVSTLSVAVGLV